jgi:metal-responsive CopG/Arc/MetJ family transcriptional regulator
MKKRTQRSHARAPGMTQITVSLPSDLVTRVDAVAGAENRTRSNFIATQLEALAEQRKAAAAAPSRRLRATG